MIIVRVRFIKVSGHPMTLAEATTGKLGFLMKLLVTALSLLKAHN